MQLRIIAEQHHTKCEYWWEMTFCTICMGMIVSNLFFQYARGILSSIKCCLCCAKLATRIGVRRTGEVLSAAKRTGPDGKEYYDIQVPQPTCLDDNAGVHGSAWNDAIL